MDAPPPVHCCLTVRADFLDLVPGRADVRPFFERPLWLGAMTATESLDAVREPARRFGVEIDAALADALVDQLDEEPSRLPLLATTLEALWPSIRPGPAAGGWLLPLPASGAPRIEDGIAARAEDAVRKLDPAEAPHLPKVLRRLARVVGGRPTRRVVRRAEVGAEEWPILTHLASARLVSLSRQDGGGPDGEATAELVHEALLERWARLRDIVHENGPFLKFRDELDADLRRWLDRDQHPDRLLPESAFAEAERWRAARPEDLTDGQLTFIAASGEAIKAERDGKLKEARLKYEASQRRLKWVGASGMAAVILLALAWGMAQEARGERTKALRAVDTILADRAEGALRAGQRERAYLIAAQAVRWPQAPAEERRPSDDHADAILLLAARNLIAPRVEPDSKLSIDDAGTRVWIVQGSDRPGGVIKGYDIDERGDLTLHGQLPLGRRVVSSFQSADAFAGLSRDGHYAWLMTAAETAEYDESRLVVLRLDDLAEVRPQWVYPCSDGDAPDPCPAADIQVSTRSYGPTDSDAIVRDDRGRTALFSLDRRPMMTRLEGTIEHASPFLAVSPGRSLLMQSSGSQAKMWELPDGGPARGLAPLDRDAGASDRAPWAGFLDDHSIVALRDGRLSIVQRDHRRASVDLGPVSAVGRVFCHAGRFVVLQRLAHAADLYEIRNGRAERVPLPADAQVLFHAGDHVVEVRGDRHLSLHDEDPRAPAFLDRAVGPDDPDRVLFPEGGDGTLFFLSGQRSIELWQRQADRVGRPAVRIAVVGEFAPPTRSPHLSADGRMIAFADDDAAGYQIQPTANLFARRGEPLGDAIVARAEGSLTRCLTGAELGALGILPGTGYPVGAQPQAQPGRHACPSALEIGDPSAPDQQGWRHLMRALISAFDG